MKFLLFNFYIETIVLSLPVIVFQGSQHAHRMFNQGNPAFSPGDIIRITTYAILWVMVNITILLSGVLLI